MTDINTIYEKRAIEFAKIAIDLKEKYNRFSVIRFDCIFRCYFYRYFYFFYIQRFCRDCFFSYFFDWIWQICFLASSHFATSQPPSVFGNHQRRRSRGFSFTNTNSLEADKLSLIRCIQIRWIWIFSETILFFNIAIALQQLLGNKH